MLHRDDAAGKRAGHAGLRGGGFAVHLAEGGGAGEGGGSEEIAAASGHDLFYWKTNSRNSVVCVRCGRRWSGSAPYRERAALAAAGLGVSTTGATAGTGSLRIMPSVLRSSVSSCWRISGLSFRNWRAFSRPWPM